MAAYDGETLKETLARGPLPLADVLDYGAQIADGLDAAHAAVIVHRDVKPGSLMVTGCGRVKILGLGLATTSRAGVTSDAVPLGPAALGSIAYMSPDSRERLTSVHVCPNGTSLAAGWLASGPWRRRRAAWRCARRAMAASGPTDLRAHSSRAARRPGA
jgi:serine/threonine protein kinase